MPSSSLADFVHYKCRTPLGERHQVRDRKVVLLIGPSLRAVFVRRFANQLMRLLDLRFEPSILCGRARALLEHVEIQRAQIAEPQRAADQRILRSPREDW